MEGACPLLYFYYAYALRRRYALRRPAVPMMAGLGLQRQDPDDTHGGRGSQGRGDKLHRAANGINYDEHDELHNQEEDHEHGSHGRGHRRAQASPVHERKAQALDNAKEADDTSASYKDVWIQVGKAKGVAREDAEEEPVFVGLSGGEGRCVRWTGGAAARAEVALPGATAPLYSFRRDCEAGHSVDCLSGATWHRIRQRETRTARA